MKKPFKPLTDGDKKVLKKHFRGLMAKELRALRDHFEKRRIDTFPVYVDSEDV